MTPAETIARLEAVREYFAAQLAFPLRASGIDRETREHIATIESALAALREKDQRASAATSRSGDSGLTGSVQSEAHPMPEKSHCACKFSSGGVLSKTCEFHRRLIQSEREKAAREAAEICESERPLELRDEWDDGYNGAVSDLKDAILKHFNLEAK